MVLFNLVIVIAPHGVFIFAKSRRPPDPLYIDMRNQNAQNWKSQGQKWEAWQWQEWESSNAGRQPSKTDWVRISPS